MYTTIVKNLPVDANEFDYIVVGIEYDELWYVSGHTDKGEALREAKKIGALVMVNPFMDDENIAETMMI